MSNAHHRDNASPQRPARREHVPDLSFRVVSPPDDLAPAPLPAESWPAWTDRTVSIADVDPADWPELADLVPWTILPRGAEPPTTTAATDDIIDLPLFGGKGAKR